MQVRARVDLFYGHYRVQGAVFDVEEDQFDDRVMERVEPGDEGVDEPAPKPARRQSTADRRRAADVGKAPAEVVDVAQGADVAPEEVLAPPIPLRRRRTAE